MCPTLYAISGTDFIRPTDLYDGGGPCGTATLSIVVPVVLALHLAVKRIKIDRRPLVRSGGRAFQDPAHSFAHQPLVKIKEGGPNIMDLLVGLGVLLLSVHAAQAQTAGIATYYAGPADNAAAGTFVPSFGILDGSCGYGQLNQEDWPNWAAASIGPGNPLVASGIKSGCGACIQVTCMDPACAAGAQNNPLTVWVTDSCAQCAPNQVNIHVSAFTKSLAATAGQVAVVYQQVPCNPPGNIVVKVVSYQPPPSAYIRLALLSVAGNGAITSVRIRSSGSPTWAPMVNNFGATFEGSSFGAAPYDLEITAAGSAPVVALGAITTGSVGQFPTSVQIGRAASAAGTALPSAATVSPPPSPQPTLAATPAPTLPPTTLLPTTERPLPHQQLCRQRCPPPHPCPLLRLQHSRRVPPVAWLPSPAPAPTEVPLAVSASSVAEAPAAAPTPAPSIPESLAVAGLLATRAPAPAPRAAPPAAKRDAPAPAPAPVQAATAARQDAPVPAPVVSPPAEAPAQESIANVMVAPVPAPAFPPVPAPAIDPGLLQAAAALVKAAQAPGSTIVNAGTSNSGSRSPTPEDINLALQLANANANGVDLNNVVSNIINPTVQLRTGPASPAPPTAPAGRKLLQ
ncbi:hypothetical protein WJX72_011488 [[Myrmecia] bisecta]|uniref:Expansin-like EG45 domain-containing protein n=1 Tax=[Myrmecia] bisecta TaxID=41462 RepID=A0AAW1PYU1_9CHLO